jgi:hypothetical protein
MRQIVRLTIGLTFRGQRQDNAMSVNDQDQVNHQVHLNGWLCDICTSNNTLYEFSQENWKKKEPAMHTRGGDFKITKHLT